MKISKLFILLMVSLTLIFSQLQRSVGEDQKSEDPTKEEVSGEAKEEVSGEAKDEVSGEAKEEVSGEAKDEVSGEAKEEVSGEAKEEVSGEATEEVSGETKKEVKKEEVKKEEVKKEIEPKSETPATTKAPVQEKAPEGGIFPWPAFKASAYRLFPRSIIVADEKKPVTLGELKNRLSKILESQGYSKIGFYYIPNGFVIVTQLEKIEKTNMIAKENRWVPGIEAISPFNPWSYLDKLKEANEGHYRFFAFAVTNQTMLKRYPLGRKDSDLVTQNTKTSVENNLLTKEFGQDYECWALVYKFEKKKDLEAVQGIYFDTAEDHLIKSNLWEAFGLPKTETIAEKSSK